MPMGSPLSPRIADIFLNKLLDETYTKLGAIYVRVKFLVRYEDYIFAVVERQTRILYLGN